MPVWLFSRNSISLCLLVLAALVAFACSGGSSVVTDTSTIPDDPDSLTTEEVDSTTQDLATKDQNVPHLDIQPLETPVEDDIGDCLPVCEGMECGPDGCGGECGVCPDGFVCDPDEWACMEKPEYCDDPPDDLCGDKECGPDGCGGSCGECAEDYLCNLDSFKCDKEDPVEACTGPGEFLCPCQGNNDCVSGFCVESHDGKVCTMNCIEDCPQGWACQQNQLALPDVLYLCLPQNLHLCKPCNEHDECGSPYVNSGELCVSHGDNGSFCGVDCTALGKCPEDFVCADVEVDGKVANQCVPSSGECECSIKSAADGAWTECVKSNGYGICYGERSCQPEGLTDCDATTPKPEECNDIDDNCDGEIDPSGSLKCITYYFDNDGDGYGIGAGECLCEPKDPKQVTLPGDCDDASTGVNPSINEACNFVDDDCDGATDESFADGCETMYFDGDHDGYGDSAVTDCLCKESDDYKLESGDCDDTDPLSSPGAEELCDGVDNNCDGVIDEENALGCTPYYLDQDKDSYGLSDQLKCLCDKIGDYTSTKGGDCDDTEYNIHPTVVELCDGLDNDCDDEIDEEEAVQTCGVVANGAVVCDGGCKIAECDGGFHDLNEAYADGCECQTEQDEVPNQLCTDAAFVGDMPDSGSSTSRTGKIVPVDDSDWYKFQAIDTVDQDNCDTFHIRVRFLKNPNDAYQFDVFAGGCAGADNMCSETTFFEFFTDFHDPSVEPGVPGGECKCMPDANHTITEPDEVNHIPYDADDTSASAHQCTNQSKYYYVKVYRKPGIQAACDDYQIEFSNGIKE